MTSLVDLGADVDWPDMDTAAAFRARVTPSQANGRLDDLADWLSAAQGADPPRDFRRARLITLGGSACPPEIADLGGVTVQTASADEADDPAAAIAAGVALADDEIDHGADLLVLAIPTIDVSALVLVSVLTNTEPVKVMPRGAGVDPATWMAQAVQVRDDRRRAFGLREDPERLLAASPGPTLATAVGFVLGAARRRTPLLLDGLGATAAALVAYEVQPRAVRWWRPADLSAHPAHEVALARFGQQPILQLGTGFDDGTAGVLAAAVLRATVRRFADTPRVRSREPVPGPISSADTPLDPRMPP